MWAMENNRCMHHGGKNKPGVDSPVIKHGLRADPVKNMAIPGGRKASALPERFYDNVMAAAEDPNLGSLFDEILIVDARISDLQKRIDTGESGQMWLDLGQLKEDWLKTSDPDERYDILREIFRKIDDGSTDHMTWLDINAEIELKARLLKADAQLAVDRGLMIRSDRVLLLVRAIIEIVMREVADPDIQERIRLAVGRLLDRPEVNLNGNI